jgi:hypothetical protein
MAGCKFMLVSVIHLDIIAGKEWVEHDGTSTGVVEELEEAGIP